MPRRTDLDVGDLVVQLEKMETVKKEIARSGSFISWPGVVGQYTGSLPLYNHELSHPGQQGEQEVSRR